MLAKLFLSSLYEYLASGSPPGSASFQLALAGALDISRNTWSRREGDAALGAPASSWHWQKLSIKDVLLKAAWKAALPGAARPRSQAVVKRSGGHLLAFQFNSCLNQCRKLTERVDLL